MTKTTELRSLSDEQLEDKLAETRQELFNLRFQSATGALENTGRLTRTKREIARILTIQNERAYGAAQNERASSVTR